MKNASDNKQWEWIKTLDEREAKLVMKDLLDVCIGAELVEFTEDRNNVGPCWVNSWGHSDGDPLVPGTETWVKEGKG